MMKINNNGISGINPYKQHMKKMDKQIQSGQKADKVEISSAAKEMQVASQITVERQAKVEELKAKVENGSYKVDAQAVAKSIQNFYKM